MLETINSDIFISKSHHLYAEKCLKIRMKKVVDKWVLENFMKSDSSIVRMYKKVDDLLLLIVVIFVVNIILSILTVNNIISRPPAELAVKD